METKLQKQVRIVEDIQSKLAEFNRAITTAQQQGVFTEIELKQINLAGSNTILIVQASVSIALSDA